MRPERSAWQGRCRAWSPACGRCGRGRAWLRVRHRDRMPTPIATPHAEPHRLEQRRGGRLQRDARPRLWLGSLDRTRMDSGLANARLANSRTAERRALAWSFQIFEGLNAKNPAALALGQVLTMTETTLPHPTTKVKSLCVSEYYELCAQPRSASAAGISIVGLDRALSSAAAAALHFKFARQAGAADGGYLGCPSIDLAAGDGRRRPVSGALFLVPTWRYIDVEP